jgi:hypothetical protein
MQELRLLTGGELPYFAVAPEGPLAPAEEGK